MMRVGMFAQHAKEARTPKLWNAAIKKLNIDAEIELQDFFGNTSSELEDKIEGGNFDVAILGYPNKKLAINLLSKVDDLEVLCGHNLVIRKKGGWLGYNFDGVAFYKSLIEKFTESFNNSLFVFLGSGSTSNSCSAVIRKHYGEKASLQIPRQKYSNKDTFELILSSTVKSEPRIENLILVNCTPMGKNNTPILPSITLAKNQNKPIIIYDLNYFPESQSPWSEIFADERFMDGKQMNLIQAALGFRQVFLQDVMDEKEVITLFNTIE